MTEQPSGDHRMDRHARIYLIAIPITAVVFFMSGYFTSTLLNEGRVRDQASERFHEFLSIGLDLGFVTVDRQKLVELECISSEAQWETADAVEREQGGKP